MISQEEITMEGGKKEIKSRDLEGGRGTQGEVIRGSAGRREVTPAEEEA